jgi:RNA polymerase Rpb4
MEGYSSGTTAPEKKKKDDNCWNHNRNSGPRLISNAAVLGILQRRLADRGETTTHAAAANSTNMKGPVSHRDWVERRVVDYLQQQQRSSDHCALDAAAADKLSQILQTRFDLVEAEALQIVNWIPTELVEVHTMVEDLHDRMTTSKQEELLRTVQEFCAAAAVADAATRSKEQTREVAAESAIEIATDPPKLNGRSRQRNLDEFGNDDGPANADDDDEVTVGDTKPAARSTAKNGNEMVTPKRKKTR